MLTNFFLVLQWERAVLAMLSFYLLKTGSHMKESLIDYPSLLAQAHSFTVAQPLHLLTQGFLLSNHHLHIKLHILYPLYFISYKDMEQQYLWWSLPSSKQPQPFYYIALLFAQDSKFFQMMQSSFPMHFIQGGHSIKIPLQVSHGRTTIAKSPKWIIINNIIRNMMLNNF